MLAHELNAAIDRIQQDAQLPKRKGGLGPLQRQYATRERIERGIIATEKTAEQGFSGPNLEAQAIQLAKDAEPKSSLIGALFAWILPIVIEWIVKRWLAKRGV